VRYERVVACPDPHARDFRADTETDESLTDTDIPWSGKPTVRAAGAADYSETRKGPVDAAAAARRFLQVRGNRDGPPVLSGEIRKVWRPWRDSNPRYPP
jgi:hypothetical protein